MLWLPAVKNDAGRPALQPIPGETTGKPPRLRPKPGGRTGTAATAVAAQDEAPLPGAEGEASLLVPAMPLLQLMTRLRSMATQPDPAALRQRTEAEMRGFEARAEKAGLPADQIRRGSYALCASLDDLVLATPWGAHGAWAERPLVPAFHPAIGQGRFFDLLRQAQGKGESFRPLLTLLHACLSAGMLGPYREEPGGAATVEAMRAAAAAELSRAAPAAAALAPHWRGVDAPFRPGRRGLPVWVVAAAALAALGAGYLLLSLRVNDRSDTLLAEMDAAAPSHMPQVTRPAAPPPPPPPAPAEPSAQDRLRGRLAQAVAEGSLAVVGTASSPVLRLPDSRLFAGDTATLLPGAAPLLAAVAEALGPEHARLAVAGFLDNRAVHTVLFPSAFRLSAARAEAVRAALQSAPGATAGITAQGRAAADPVAPNATAEGREQNRRIEIAVGAPAP